MAVPDVSQKSLKRLTDWRLNSNECRILSIIPIIPNGAEGNFFSPPQAEGQKLSCLTPEPLINSIILKVESMVDMSLDEEGTNRVCYQRFSIPLRWRWTRRYCASEMRIKDINHSSFWDDWRGEVLRPYSPIIQCRWFKKYDGWKF